MAGDDHSSLVADAAVNCFSSGISFGWCFLGNCGGAEYCGGNGGCWRRKWAKWGGGGGGGPWYAKCCDWATNGWPTFPRLPPSESNNFLNINSIILFLIDRIVQWLLLCETTLYTYVEPVHVTIEWRVVSLDLVILMQLDRVLCPVQSMPSYPVKQPSQFQRLRQQHKSIISEQAKNQSMVKTNIMLVKWNSPKHLNRISEQRLILRPLSMRENG